jgi:redox-sensitive bicupin YhaK (pirin superfamily)
MIELRPFDELPREDLGWLKARRHFSSAAQDDPSRSGWGCMRVWNDEEIAPNAGFALQVHTNIEIITYVREGTVTHRDSLGNEGRIEAGNVQVVSAGTGIRHAEYNLEQASARIFQIWITPASSGGSPAWGVQPCAAAERSGCFVALASGFDSDHDALPIRACARVLNAKAATDDVLACYRGLAGNGVRRIALRSDSAGGNLALGLASRHRRSRLQPMRPLSGLPCCRR